MKLKKKKKINILQFSEKIYFFQKYVKTITDFKK